MTALSIPNQIVNNAALDATKVNANFTAIQAHVNNEVPADILASMPIGSMQMFLGAITPNPLWILARGQAVSRSTYAALFTLLGTTYGAGDGSTTFNLPDLAGNMPIGLKSADANFDTLNKKGGSRTTTLIEANLPPHAHTINHDHAAASTSTDGSHTHTESVTVGGNNNAGGSFGGFFTGTDQTSAAGAHAHTVDLPNFTGNSGNGNGVSTPAVTVSPFIVVNFIIKAL